MVTATGPTRRTRPMRSTPPSSADRLTPPRSPAAKNARWSSLVVDAAAVEAGHNYVVQGQDGAGAQGDDATLQWRWVGLSQRRTSGSHRSGRTALIVDEGGATAVHPGRDGVDGRAAGRGQLGLGGAAVVRQRPQAGVGVVQIARLGELSRARPVIREVIAV